MGERSNGRRRSNGNSKHVPLSRPVQQAQRQWKATSREAEVLGLLTLGESTKGIADRLGCAESTIEVHITRLLRKAGVKSRTALVAKFWLTFGTTAAQPGPV